MSLRARSWSRGMRRTSWIGRILRRRNYSRRSTRNRN